MSLRLEMLQVARLAPKLLSESTELVTKFLVGEQNDDGGFKDRTGKSDLYYTVFGLDGLLALEVRSPEAKAQNQTASTFEQVPKYLRSFGNGASLDFVHVCCLARCWAATASRAPAESHPPGLQNEILRRVELYRSKEGGYNPTIGSEFGTAYGCFLALGAYQDLKAAMPESLRLVQCLKFLETEDGAWTNERRPHSARRIPRSQAGSTNATAAAVTVLRNLSVPINQSVGNWLLARAHPQGGFRAMPDAPVPDLLSTATALHALAGLQVSFEPLKERCLDFIDTLWTNEGGFCGHWGDDHLDCEYTYYGLLALGHLSL